MRTIDTAFNHPPRYRVTWRDSDGYVLLVVIWDEPEPPSPLDDIHLAGGAVASMSWEVI